MKRKSTEKEEIVPTPSNHGVRWLRGRLIGKGTFGSVFMASLRQPISKFSIFPPVMAVKSAEVSNSETLQKEKQTFDNLKRCSSLIKCFGEEITTDENGMMIYNLLLEFAGAGTLADQIKNTDGKGLSEKEAGSYTRSIIKGLIHIHKSQYVHCDLKPENILLVPRNSTKGRPCVAKIGDLGLARRTSKTKKDRYLRGTPPYMAPETLLYNVQESPSDIWALGCLVLEMLTGNRPWSGGGDDMAEITRRIGEKYEIPIIPDGVVLSADARGFLKACFVRKPEFRFTAEMLMLLPFVVAAEEEEEEEELVVGGPRFVDKTRRSKRQRIPIQAV